MQSFIVYFAVFSITPLILPLTLTTLPVRYCPVSSKSGLSPLVACSTNATFGNPSYGAAGGFDPKNVNTGSNGAIVSPFAISGGVDPSIKVYLSDSFGSNLIFSYSGSKKTCPGLMRLVPSKDQVICNGVDKAGRTSKLGATSGYVSIIANCVVRSTLVSNGRRAWIIAPHPTIPGISQVQYVGSDANSLKTFMGLAATDSLYLVRLADRAGVDRCDVTHSISMMTGLENFSTSSNGVFFLSLSKFGASPSSFWITPTFNVSGNLGFALLTPNPVGTPSLYVGPLMMPISNMPIPSTTLSVYTDVFSTTGAMSDSLVSFIAGV